MNSPVEILLAVAGIGGQLGIAGDKLRMLLPLDCAPELKAAIRQQKVHLLELLRLNFLVVQSESLNTTVLWCADARTKEALIVAGGDTGTIYTPDELRVMVNHRVTAGELPAIHAARAGFKGRLREP